MLKVAQISFLLDRHAATNMDIILRVKLGLDTKNKFTFGFDENVPILCEPNVNFTFFLFPHLYDLYVLMNKCVFQKHIRDKKS